MTYLHSVNGYREGDIVTIIANGIHPDGVIVHGFKIGQEVVIEKMTETYAECLGLIGDQKIHQSVSYSCIEPIPISESEVQAAIESIMKGHGRVELEKEG